MMTPEVVSEIIPLESGLFDLLIFDEASQMFVEKGLPSILRAKKVVIAGDHKQLRPNNLFSGRIEMEESDVEDTDVSTALEEESLLDLARAKFNDVLLNFHYRSKYEELIAFSNHAFYNGRLYVSPNSSIPEEPPITVHMVEDARWIDRTNMEEAVKVVSLLKEFLENRKNNETIGIITFNSDQRDLIEDVIDDECRKDPKFAVAIESERNRKSDDGEDIGLFVKNIENVQGDERDEIIFSIAYAKGPNGRLVQRFGWLNQKGGENRLNVAISRAKKKVRIVLSFDPDDLQVESAKNEGPKILKKYLKYAKAVSDGNTELAQEILKTLSDTPNDTDVDWFDSPFEEEVCQALRDRGYEVRTQVGIGGYRIDMAVVKGDRYVLGIECDGRLYHSSSSARERDFHRQKYLESRGWRIHRIWSSNWWNNRQNEIDKIVNLVEAA
jgi:superfamily I DNA and/or RNA helicase/very-short-patch-repair endonuclease